MIITLPMNDQFIEIEVRRRKGQFYTPTNLAKHGWAYLRKIAESGGLSLRHRVE